MRTCVKSIRCAVLLYLAVLGTGLLAGCGNPLKEPDLQDGSVEIALSATLNGSRTLYPEADFVKYTLSFSGPANHGDVELTGGQNSLVVSDLAKGTWTISAKGFVNIQGLEYEAAQGSAQITVGTGSQSISIPISASQGGDPGFLSYSVRYPLDKIISAALELSTFAGASVESKDLAMDPSGRFSLSPGYYVLTVNGLNPYQTVGHTEVVHIYSNMETKADFDFSDEELRSIPGVIRVNFDAGSTKTINLTGLNSNTVFLVKVNTSAKVINQPALGGVSGSWPAWQTVPVPSLSPDFPDENDRPYLPGHSLADQFHANPPPIAPKAGRIAAPLPAPAALNDSKLFWVESIFGSGNFVQKQATLRAQGTYGNIWVLDNDYNASSSSTTDKKLSLAQAQRLAEKFDLIYPIETKLLGYEFGGDPADSANYGGKDGDPRIQILVYDFDSAAAGFFWGKDYYDDAYIINSGYRSNEAEIFYLDVDQLNRYEEYMYSTLVHEFQHMINFNVKWVKNRVSSESWYDEMLSMAAEDCISPLIGVTPTSRFHPIGERVYSFLQNYAAEGLTDWTTLTSASYAKSYAFGAYLARNYGGAELLQTILANNTTDIASLDDALKQVSGMTFAQALERYVEAFIYSGDNRPEESVSFDNTVTKTINGTAYTFTKFNIWNERYTVDGGYYSWTGPKVYNLNQTPTLATTGTSGMGPYSVLLQSSADWKNKNSGLSITLQKPASADVALYLMVK